MNDQGGPTPQRWLEAGEIIRSTVPGAEPWVVPPTLRLDTLAARQLAADRRARHPLAS